MRLEREINVCLLGVDNGVGVRDVDEVLRLGGARFS
jgi:hypothetical protein